MAGRRLSSWTKRIGLTRQSSGSDWRSTSSGHQDRRRTPAGVLRPPSPTRVDAVPAARPVRRSRCGWGPPPDRRGCPVAQRDRRGAGRQSEWTWRHGIAVVCTLGCMCHAVTVFTLISGLGWAGLGTPYLGQAMSRSSSAMASGLPSLHASISEVRIQPMSDPRRRNGSSVSPRSFTTVAVA